MAKMIWLHCLIAGVMLGGGFPPVTERPSHSAWIDHHSAASPASEMPPFASHYEAPVRADRRPDGTASIFRTGFPAWEPTLGILDGQILVSANGPSTGPGKEMDPLEQIIIRSKDGGRAWESVYPKINRNNPHRESIDPYIHADPVGGGLFMVDLLGACSVLSRSDDVGTSWSSTTTVCGPGPNDHPNLFSGPPVSSPLLGYEQIVYYCYNAFLASFCERSLDGGRTFLPPGAPIFETIDPTAGAGTSTLGIDHFCFTPSVGHGTTDADGTVYVPRGHCGQPYLAISDDEGLTWRRVQVADNGVSTIDGDPNHEASVAVDGKGRIYYAWMGIDRMPYVAVSSDGGDSWSAPMKVGPRSLKEASFPALAVSKGGTVVFSFMGSKDSPGAPWPDNNDLGQDGGEAPFYEKATWNGYVVVGQPAAVKPAWRVVQVNPAADPLVRGACGPGRCAFGDFLDVQAAGNSGWAVFVDSCLDECITNPRGESDGLEALVVKVPLG